MCLLAFMHFVHILMRGPFGMWAHCKLGYFLLFPQGLNFVARTELEYFPTILDPFSHIGHVEFADIIYICYHKKNFLANSSP